MVLGLLVHVLKKKTPSNIFSRVLRNEALGYKSFFFFRTAILRKLFEIRFSYKHFNFARVCLLVKMALKTVTRSILNHFLRTWKSTIKFEEGERFLFVHRTWRSNRSFTDAIFASISWIQFFSPGRWYLFCDTRSQMKRWRFSVRYRFVYSFSRS